MITHNAGVSEKRINFLRKLVSEQAEMLGKEMTLEVEEWVLSSTPANINRRIEKALLKNKDLRSKARIADKEAELENPLEDGFYEYDDTVYKVITSPRTGRQYAKLLDVEIGKWEYAPGQIKYIRKLASPLTLERAQELGQLYGICVRCGAILTDETSIANGIGPICAGKF